MPAKIFDIHFDIIPANSGAMLEEAFRLRHQIYCEELGFEQQRADRLEHDKHDEKSIHCLLFHKASKTYIGCIRLILADGANPEAPFPFELACGKSLQWSFDSAAGKGRQKHGEISRLAIIANFRRFRRNEVRAAGSARQNFYAADEDEAHLFPSIALGLYLAVTVMVLNQGLDGVFAMMEPRLARRLRRFGIFFEPVGDAVEHHGTRVPFFINSHTILNTLKPECLALLGKIKDTLAVHHAQQTVSV
jgi:N-acyl amino acid synthase of PEP-CTERM/exosortase system